MKKTLKKNKKGFTLVEIIVVLVIMGILLAIAVPSVMGYVNKANEQKYIAQARNGFLGATTIVATENAKE
ncbi:MAG: prepilin-type N-terminal cleavage/methylation domain-containing protein, partial [Longicatena sp.]